MLIPFKVYTPELKLMEQVFCFAEISPDDLKTTLVVEENYSPDIIVVRASF